MSLFNFLKNVLWGLIFFCCICSGFAMVPQNMLQLKGGSLDSPVLYVFKNKSAQSIWLDRYFEGHRPPMSAGWSSQIDPGRWSGFVLNQDHFNMSCSILTNSQVKFLDCHKILKVYRISKVLPLRMKSYTGWYVENKNFFGFWFKLL